MRNRKTLPVLLLIALTLCLFIIINFDSGADSVEGQFQDLSEFQINKEAFNRLRLPTQNEKRIARNIFQMDVQSRRLKSQKKTLLKRKVQPDITPERQEDIPLGSNGTTLVFPMKYAGSVKQNNKRRAFLIHEGNYILASEGDILVSRFVLKNIDFNNIRLFDKETKKSVTISSANNE